MQLREAVEPVADGALADLEPRGARPQEAPASQAGSAPVTSRSSRTTSSWLLVKPSAGPAAAVGAAPVVCVVVACRCRPPSSLPSSGPPGSSSQDDPTCTIRIGLLSTPGALTPTSYIVLGLLAFAGEATPYELKAGHAGSVGSFWSVPHSQLYAEPERLAAAGLVSVRREDGGRRRKHYALTDAGREALRDWLADAGTPPAEFREPALLKLFFGADPAVGRAGAARQAPGAARSLRGAPRRAARPPTGRP